MNTAREITVIPAMAPRFSVIEKGRVQRKKVAAYARVSTDTEEQLTSYEAQVDYYTKHIRSNLEWQFIEVFTDEGISATNTKKRDGFRRMIQDALDGKVDLILTKSVSRFARNTVDTLTTVRQLKEKGVEVYFEKENIWTLDSKGELLITIMSSLAQEESRSISENVKWGQRKRFADGKVNLPYKRFLGYEKGDDGLPKVIPEEAKIVQRIYSLFLEGKTPTGIASLLTADGIPTPAGKQRWQASTVESILTNEKYKGDAILQKCFTVNFLTKKQKLNEGEVPQYYVEHSHEAIIPRGIHDLVQDEMKRRKAIGKQYSAAGAFSGKLICGECGGLYGSKVWHSTSKYRRVIWRCNEKYKNDAPCSTPHLNEEEIKNAFVSAFNKQIENKKTIITEIKKTVARLIDTSDFDSEIQTLTAERDVVSALIKECIEENTIKALDQREYEQRYNTLAERYEIINNRINENTEKREQLEAKHRKISRCLEVIRETDTLLTEFDEKMWNLMLESATVYSRERIIFLFADGTEVEESISIQ